MQLKKGQRGAMSGQDRKPSDSEERVLQFEEEIRQQEDILYGVALFYEGVSALCHEEADDGDARRMLFQDIIQTGRAQIDRAVALLEQVKKSPSQTALLDEFVFSPCQGHENPEELVKQSRILMRLYEEVFPGRPRDQAFAENEIFKLIESAADKMI